MFYAVLTLIISVIFFVVPAVSAAEALSVLSVSNTTPTAGDPITVAMTLSQGAASQSYYLKCRIGEDSTHLTQGQTYNPDSGVWLDDSGANGAWTLMPRITVGSDGSWQGEMQCRVKTSAESGAKLVFTRACLSVDGTCKESFQSADSVGIQVLAPPPTSTPPPSPEPTPPPTATPTVQKTPTRAPIQANKPSATSKILLKESSAIGSAVTLAIPSVTGVKNIGYPEIRGDSTAGSIMRLDSAENVPDTPQRSPRSVVLRKVAVALIIVALGLVLIAIGKTCILFL